MSRDLDVAIIGAGLGGLACGAALAREGVRVAVFERHDVVGGYATSFARGPYRFEASLHLLDGVEPSMANAPVWDALGLRGRLELVRPDELRREIWPGRTLDIPHGLDPWVDALTGVFPRCREGLKQVVALAEEVHHTFIRDRDHRLNHEASPPMDARIQSLANRTARDVLDAHLDDDEAIAVAASLSAYLGLPADELAAVAFLTMLISYQRDGGTFPLGGGQAISDALAAEIVQHGGSVYTGAHVERVLTDRVGVTGLQVEGMGTVDARYVVSNASPVLLYGQLLQDARIPTRFTRRLEHMTLGTSVIKLWLGTDTAFEDQPYEVFLRGSYRTQLDDMSLDGIAAVFTHRVDPSCCPENHGSISLTVGVEAGCGRVPPDQARSFASAMVERVDAALGTRLSDHTVLTSLATPDTFHDYTHNPGGTIHGFRPIPSQSAPRRLGLTGPISRLYHAGGWSMTGSGYTPSMTSGLLAARAITGEMR